MFNGMEYVYEAYKEKSFSNSAKKLFISQPSLSATVKRVENRIGYPIFNRNTTPLTLTECGEHYIKAVEEILAIQTSFQNFINDLEDLKTGSLTLGGSSLFSALVFPKLIGEFTRRFPKVTIDLIEESTSRLEQLLMSGVIDLVIDNYHFNESYIEQVVYQEEHLLLAVPRDFMINRQFSDYQIPVEQIRSQFYLQEQIPPVPLEKFSDQPFILLKQENDTRQRAMQLCRKHGFTPKIILALDQQMTSYNVTCSGMGISFISDTLVRNTYTNPKVCYYKLEGPDATRNIYFCWKNGKYKSRAMEEFLKLASSSPA